MKKYFNFVNDNLKYMKNLPFKMNLQFFAGEASGDGSNTAGASASQGEQNGSGEPKTYTEEELQAAINSAVQQRLARQKRDEEKRIEAARAEGRSEAEKLAKMTEDQRVEHERQRAEQAARDREEAITRREADITRRELRAAAIDTLAQKGLPRGLEAILTYTDADACNASIDAVEKVFREAVQEGVNERLRASGVSLRNSGNNDYSRMSDADYYAATYKPGRK